MFSHHQRATPSGWDDEFLAAWLHYDLSLTTKSLTERTFDLTLLPSVRSHLYLTWGHGTALKTKLNHAEGLVVRLTRLL